MTGPLDFRLFKSFCFAIHKFKIHSHDYDVLRNPMYCTLMLFKRHYTSISNSVQSILRMVWFLMQEIQTLKQWGQSQSANKAIVLAQVVYTVYSYNSFCRLKVLPALWTTLLTFQICVAVSRVQWLLRFCKWPTALESTLQCCSLLTASYRFISFTPQKHLHHAEV